MKKPPKDFSIADLRELRTKATHARSNNKVARDMCDVCDFAIWLMQTRYLSEPQREPE